MRNRVFYFAGSICIVLIIFHACTNEQRLDYQRYFVNGKGLYGKNCQNCHGGKGEGLGKLYPPLTDTLFLSKSRALLACIIKNGTSAKLASTDNTYESIMPGNSVLADIEIAQIIVYVTNSFGNTQGFYDQTQVGVDLTSCK